MIRACAVLTVCGLFWFAFIPGASAQEDLGRFERQLEQLRRDQFLRIDSSIPTERRALVDYGAYTTVSYLSLDDQENGNHVLRQYEIVGYARLNIDNVHEFFLRGRTGYQDFNDGDSFDGKGDELIDPTIEAAYYKFDLRRALEAYKGKESDGNITFQIGRDLVYWGNGLVMSTTLDGVIVRLESPVADVDVIAGVTPKRTVDFDTSRPDFDDETLRGFYGAQISKRVGRHRPFAYAVAQRDYNDDDELNFTQPEIQTRFQYDSYYLALGSQGALGDKLLYGFEVVYEGGYGLSNSYARNDDGTVVGVQQTDEEIHAFAADARLDYLVGDDRQTRFSIEGIAASGDPDRDNSTTDTFGGNRPGTSDLSFNSLGFVNTGLAFAPPVSNLLALRVGVSTFPFPHVGMLDRMQIGFDGFVFGKAQKDGQITEPTNLDERYLGWEPDVFMNWQITNDVTLAVRYGIFFPGSGLQNDDEARQFFFAGVTYAF